MTLVQWQMRFSNYLHSMKITDLWKTMPNNNQASTGFYIKTFTKAARSCFTQSSRILEAPRWQSTLHIKSSSTSGDRMINVRSKALSLLVIISVGKSNSKNWHPFWPRSRPWLIYRRKSSKRWSGKQKYPAQSSASRSWRASNWTTSIHSVIMLHWYKTLSWMALMVFLRDACLRFKELLKTSWRNCRQLITRLKITWNVWHHWRIQRWEWGNRVPGICRLTTGRWIRDLVLRTFRHLVRPG